MLAHRVTLVIELENREILFLVSWHFITSLPNDVIFGLVSYSPNRFPRREVNSKIFNHYGFRHIKSYNSNVIMNLV